jgi:hypothetical protein
VLVGLLLPNQPALWKCTYLIDACIYLFIILKCGPTLPANFGSSNTAPYGLVDPPSFRPHHCRQLKPVSLPFITTVLYYLHHHHHHHHHCYYLLLLLLGFFQFSISFNFLLRQPLFQSLIVSNRKQSIACVFWSIKMGKKRVMVPAKDVDLSSVKYEPEIVQG